MKALAHHDPEHIYFSGRSTKTAEALVAEIRTTKPKVSITFIEMDLASLASVKASANKFTHGRLDLLMCNAGIMATPPALSKDGYEIQFATNHLGHAMLIRQLLPVMLKTANSPNSDVRIVCLTSDGWKGHPGKGVSFSTIRTTQDTFFGAWTRYGYVIMAIYLIIFPSQLLTVI